jgi:hypothetical protein
MTPDSEAGSDGQTSRLPERVARSSLPASENLHEAVILHIRHTARREWERE